MGAVGDPRDAHRYFVAVVRNHTATGADAMSAADWWMLFAIIGGLSVALASMLGIFSTRGEKNAAAIMIFLLIVFNVFLVIVFLDKLP
jgi:Na+-driven multidrug efflux pump